MQTGSKVKIRTERLDTKAMPPNTLFLYVAAVFLIYFFQKTNANTADDGS